MNHSAKEYVKGSVHKDGIKSLWAILKRSNKGTYHWWSTKHMQRYVNEFCGRHNHKEKPTADRMGPVMDMMAGKRLTWALLVYRP